MNLLTYFYETYLVPTAEGMMTAFRRIVEWLLLGGLWLSFPVWLPIYLLIKKTKED